MAAQPGAGLDTAAGDARSDPASAQPRPQMLVVIALVGVQLGREGRTLRQVSVPDEVVIHEPGACAGCGADLPADGRPGWSGGRCSTSRRSPCGWSSTGWSPAAAPVAY